HLLLTPPEVMRDEAKRIGFEDPILEARGYDALEVRVASAYAAFIAPGEFVFRARDNAARVGEVVTFNWDMVALDGDVSGGCVRADGGVERGVRRMGRAIGVEPEDLAKELPHLGAAVPRLVDGVGAHPGVLAQRGHPFEIAGVEERLVLVQEVLDLTSVAH